MARNRTLSLVQSSPHFVHYPQVPYQIWPFHLTLFKMFEPFTQLASLDKLTPWNRSTFYKISTSTLKPAFKRPALQNIATMSRRFSHLVSVPYYKLNYVKNVRETIERGERHTKFPNPAVSSHQLLLNATTNYKAMQFISPSKRLPPNPISTTLSSSVRWTSELCHPLARRFSTNPTPVLYYQAIKDGEAIKRKEYVDIHDGEVWIQKIMMCFLKMWITMYSRTRYQRWAGFHIYMRQRSLTQWKKARKQLLSYLDLCAEWSFRPSSTTPTKTKLTGSTSSLPPAPRSRICQLK